MSKAKAPAKRPSGQYVRYGPTATRLVCEDLAAGRTWEAIGATGEGRPSYSTMYKWRKTYPEFAQVTEDARVYGADACADRALSVAEGATKDTVAQAKLYVDTLMHRAAMLAPDRWGKGRGAAPAAKAEPLEIVFSFRRFEKVIGPDGRRYVREIEPEGDA